MRFASACQPLFQAAGQLLAAGALEAAGTRAASASAAMPATTEAFMRTGYRCFSAVLDLGREPADERREVPGMDDHCVTARALELLDLVRRRHRQVGDRKLPRGNVGEQVEHYLERRLGVLSLDR